MADDFDDDVASAPTAGTGGANPAALNAALDGPAASTEEARDFLRRQSGLTDLQATILHEQHALELSHLKWRRFNDQMKGVLQIIVAALGVAVVAAIAAALWTASRADGIVVESFLVPPALAEAGLSGDVVAADVTNRLAKIRREVAATTIGAVHDIRSESRDEVHIEIPEAGISLTALWRVVRDWLGHERHVTGSVRESGNGKIALVVSLAGSDPVTIIGDAAHPPVWEQAAAEALFSVIEPIQLIFYLDDKGRYAEALAAARRVEGPGFALRYALTGNQLPLVTGDFARSAAYARLAISLAPQMQVFRSNLVNQDAALGWAEEELETARSILPLRESDQSMIGETREGYEAVRLRAERRVALLSGDYGDEAAASCLGECSAGERFVVKAKVAGLQHDPSSGKGLLALANVAGDADADGAALAKWNVAVAESDWRNAETAATNLGDALLAESNGLPARYSQTVKTTHDVPLLALAEEHLGKFADARRMIDATPRDCYDCVRVRGDIEGLANNWSAASGWFAEAVRRGPSLPFAYTDWGETLLHEGKYDAAIEKFREANLKGPHFADPIEMWGEALMQENRSDLALAKFEEANKFAPNWGRLHLKWGEALVYAGHRDEARKQFDIASGLDLSTDDRMMFSRWRAKK